MASTAAAEPFTPAARDVLKAFPIEPGQLTLINHSENVTFKVIDTRGGAAYVLRLHRPGYHALQSLQSEHVWTRALAAVGVAVPSPVAARDGRDYVEVTISGTAERRYAGLARWIQGESLADLLRRQPDVQVIERSYEQIGSLLASIHNQSASWQPPANFRRHALDADGLMGEAPFWGRFWEHPVLSVAERSLLLATRDRIHSALIRYGKNPVTYSMIHADLFPDNVLINNGRVAVIDFDDAAFGWHQYDLAVALVDLQALPSFVATQQACIRGYRAVRQISDEALAMVPLFLLARGMVQIGWFHQRPEIALPSSFKAMKDLVCAQSEVFELPSNLVRIARRFTR
jgi:Ser/Thr protein kinase RdoA (MazF antagonist)